MDNKQYEKNASRLSKEKLKEIAKLNFNYFLKITDGIKIDDEIYYENIIKPLITKYEPKIENKVTPEIDKNFQMQEKYDIVKLVKIAKINFKYFKELAEKYSQQDQEYYTSIVKPILDKHEKIISDEKAYAELEMIKRKKLRKRTFIFASFVLLLLLFFIIYNYIDSNIENNKIITEEKIRKEIEEKLRKENDAKLNEEKKRQEAEALKKRQEQEAQLLLEEKRRNDARQEELKVYQEINKIIQEKEKKDKQEFNKLTSIEKEIVNYSKEYRKVYNKSDILGYKLKNGTISESEFRKFIDKEWFPVASQFQHLVSEYARSERGYMLRDLAIKYGFLDLIGD